MTGKIMKALVGERQQTPPVWLMRQAGRHLPEYRAVRERAGDFLTLCYTPELAAEVALQPVRRYGFDAAILFADILLIAQALGADLRFVDGEGPRLSVISTAADVEALNPPDAVREKLSPVYETLRILSRELPQETATIGFAGAPWTVAAYMIAGRGVPGQGPAHRLKDGDRATFDQLIDRIATATVEYLSAQIEAGAQAVKLFDSWAGSLNPGDFRDCAVAPVKGIVAQLKVRHPETPVIVFPREARKSYAGFAKATGADCVALDDSVPLDWAAAHVQTDGCIQGNLSPRHLVSGGRVLIEETRAIVRTFRGGPHIFNLGHGITPDADPRNIHAMLEAVRDA